MGSRVGTGLPNRMRLTSGRRPDGPRLQVIRVLGRHEGSMSVRDEFSTVDLLLASGARLPTMLHAAVARCDNSH